MSNTKNPKKVIENVKFTSISCFVYYNFNFDLNRIDEKKLKQFKTSFVNGNMIGITTICTFCLRFSEKKRRKE